MLTALLPGLREIRSAIAAGFLWMLFVWLAFHNAWPSTDEATGIWESLYELGAFLTPLGYGAAVTFAAYLIGSLSDPVFNPVLTRAYELSRGVWFKLRFRRGQPRALSRLPAEVPVMTAGELSGTGSHSLANYVRQKVNEAIALGYYRTHMDDPALQNQTYAQVIGEIRLIERRLIGDQPDLHAEVDRLRSEAELRTAIAPPLVALVILLSLASSILWLVSLLAVAALFVQGQLRMRERNDSLVDILLLGRVEAPALERMRLAAEHQRES